MRRTGTAEKREEISYAEHQYQPRVAVRPRADRQQPAVERGIERARGGSAPRLHDRNGRVCRRAVQAGQRLLQRWRSSLLAADRYSCRMGRRADRIALGRGDDELHHRSQRREGRPAPLRLRALRGGHHPFGLSRRGKQRRHHRQSQHAAEFPLVLWRGPVPRGVAGPHAKAAHRFRGPVRLYKKDRVRA